MAKFLNELVAEKMHSGNWKLHDTLNYTSDLIGNVSVPQGFVTDFASVPRLPVAYVLFDGVADSSAVIHDYLRRENIINRRTADNVFLEAMKAEGVPRWRRYPMYWAVSVF